MHRGARLFVIAAAAAVAAAVGCAGEKVCSRHGVFFFVCITREFAKHKIFADLHIRMYIHTHIHT